MSSNNAPALDVNNVDEGHNNANNALTVFAAHVKLHFIQHTAVPAFKNIPNPNIGQTVGYLTLLFNALHPVLELEAAT